jgi:hypothetical protein
MQNSALGAVLATAHFPAHPLAAVPCAISACTHSLLGSMLAAVWRRNPAGLAVGNAGSQERQQGQAGLALQQAQAVAGQQLVAAKAAVDAAADLAARRAEVGAWIAGYRARGASGREGSSIRLSGGSGSGSGSGRRRGRG